MLRQFRRVLKRDSLKRCIRKLWNRIQFAVILISVNRLFDYLESLLDF